MLYYEYKKYSLRQVSLRNPKKIIFQNETAFYLPNHKFTSRLRNMELSIKHFINVYILNNAV